MTPLVRAAFGLRHTYLRYVGASAVALLIDIACFLLLVRAGAPPAGASAGGYSLGIVVHWWLSSRAVFADRLAGAGAMRVGQQALFVASAGVGLALTVGIVGIGAALGVPAWAGKALAILVSFQAVWLLRRTFVFAR